MQKYERSDLVELFIPGQDSMFLSAVVEENQGLLFTLV